MATTNVQGAPAPSMKIGNVRERIEDAKRQATADCGPLAKLAREPLVWLEDGLDLIETAGQSFGRKLSRDLSLRAFRDRGETPPGDVLGGIQQAARDVLAKRYETKGAEIADGYVKSAKAFKDAVDTAEANATGPAALRRTDRDLKALLQVASLREEMNARPFVEVLATFKGYVERGADLEIDLLGDAVEPVALAISRMSDAELLKRVGVRGGNAAANAISSTRSGDLQREQVAAIEFLAMIRDRRRSLVPPHIDGCRAAWARMLSISPLVCSFNVWLLAPSQVGNGSPRVPYKWRDELNVDPSWPTRMLPPIVNGVRPPYAVPGAGGGAK
jgi:hypothetical protein